METLETIRSQADEFRKAKNYEKAIPLYEKLWRENTAAPSEWDGWRYAFCLRKAGKSSQALDICREVFKLKPAFENNRDLYAWCVFDLEIFRPNQEIKPDEADFFKAAKAIIDLSKPGTYTAANPTILKVVDYLGDEDFHPNYPAKEIVEWLGKTTSSSLSTECPQGKGKDGLPMEYPSQLETYYFTLSKAFFETERFEECISVSEQALETLQKRHNNSDFWVKYRIGLSKGKLGKFDEGLRDLEEVYKRKKDWFVGREIAKLHFQKADYDAALKYSAQAALAPGQDQLGFKWELFMFMGQILKSQQQLEKAKDHVLLAAKVRQKEGWKIDSALAGLLRELAIDTADARSVEQIHKSLLPYWDGIVHAGQERITGKVSKWITEGKNGFIKAEDGKDYYFKVNSFKRNSRSVSLGAKVKFYGQINPEKRNPEAVEIEQVKE